MPSEVLETNRMENAHESHGDWESLEGLRIRSSAG